MLKQNFDSVSDEEPLAPILNFVKSTSNLKRQAHNSMPIWDPQKYSIKQLVNKMKVLHANPGKHLHTNMNLTFNDNEATIWLN